MVSERAFGSADFGATLRGVDMHLKAWGGVVRLHGDSTSLYFGVLVYVYIDATRQISGRNRWLANAHSGQLTLGQLSEVWTCIWKHGEGSCASMATQQAYISGY